MNVNQTSGTVAISPVIKITIWNFCRLDSLLAAAGDELSWRASAQLARKLRQSIVMDDDQIPFNVATMRSRVEFRAEGTGLSQIATLVYPGERHLHDDAISVLTPVGAAILGLSEGQSICTARPDGQARTFTMLRVLYQPEADRRRRAARADKPFQPLQLEAV